MTNRPDIPIDAETIRWAEQEGLDYAGSDKCIHWLIGGKPCPGRCKHYLYPSTTAWTYKGEPSYLAYLCEIMINNDINKLASLIKKFHVCLYIEAEKFVDGMQVKIFTKKIEAMLEKPLSSAEVERRRKVDLKQNGSPPKTSPEINYRANRRT